MDINKIPIFTFAYFDKSIGGIEAFLIEHFKERIKKGEVNSFRSKKDINDIFDEFEYLRKTKAKRISMNEYSYKAFFFNPSIKPDKVIMISSLEDGWYTLCNVISNSLKSGFYLFTLSADGVSDPQNAFHYVNKAEGISTERVVYSMKDGKWVFFEKGEPLQFENLENYKQKIIKKRLTKEILIDYCKEIELPIEQENFWKQKGEGIYFERLF